MKIHHFEDHLDDSKHYLMDALKSELQIEVPNLEMESRMGELHMTLFLLNVVQNSQKYSS